MADPAPEILVVDDDPGFRELVMEILSEEGYRPVAAAPIDALATAARQPLALALLDALMPDIDGPALCRQLRTCPHTRSLPILFITGLPRETLAPQLAGCEPWDFLAKPCTIDELLVAVGHHLSPGRRSAGAG